MTPDTLRIDRRFKSVGRIKRASGTTVPAMLRKLNRMLTALYEDGRLDLLRAVRDGHLSPLQVYDAWRRRQLQDLPVGETMPVLATAMQAWIERSESEYSAKHLEGLETARRYFDKHEPTARVADLPRLLDELRTTLGAKHPRSFNLARAAALAFVRSTLKRSHQLWISCAAVEQRKVAARPLGRLLTPDAMRANFPSPDTDTVDAIAWSLATTGMGSKEYWGRWETQSDRIHIAGTKRGGRVRDVPLVRAPSVPRLSRDRFEKKFRLRFDGAITPYDLRRTYARWMELASVQRTRRKLYMGHGARDVTDIYERAEVTTFLAEDAKKLCALLGYDSPDSTASSPESSPVALVK